MKLNKIKISNFRKYYNDIEVDIDDMTAFVGKNDSGKSTILEALDIFFNEGKGVIKIDKADLNVKGKEDNNTEVEITCVFSDLPDKIIIDDSNETSFKDDYMLNSQGLLEVVKKYKMTSENPKVTIYLKALHPTNSKCNELLSKTQSQLKDIANKLGINCEDERKNAVLRSAIWSYYSQELNVQEIYLDISSKKSSLWENIRPLLPVYSLFQSDRKNSDGDSEVQDPLKEAVKRIFKEEEDIREVLEKVARKVRDRLQEVSDATLNKLREMNPEVANTLQPQIPDTSDLKWSDVFKGLSIAGDHNIPINKRGSGVKRLILLNFFRAEAERRKDEGKNSSIIYAIEEPETSQHKENQYLLIKALKELSQNSNTQVIITTHSSEVVKCISYDDIRIIDTTAPIPIQKIRESDKNVHEDMRLLDINFIVFGDASVEYHNQLYGELQSIFGVFDTKKFDDKLALKGCSRTKIWKKEFINKDPVPSDVSLQTYIRNQIHHPENQCNEPYTDEEIKHSINEMRLILANELQQRRDKRE